MRRRRPLLNSRPRKRRRRLRGLIRLPLIVRLRRRLMPRLLVRIKSWSSRRSWRRSLLLRKLGSLRLVLLVTDVRSQRVPLDPLAMLDYAVEQVEKKATAAPTSPISRLKHASQKRKHHTFITLQEKKVPLTFHQPKNGTSCALKLQ